MGVIIFQMRGLYPSVSLFNLAYLRLCLLQTVPTAAAELCSFSLEAVFAFYLTQTPSHPAADR